MCVSLTLFLSWLNCKFPNSACALQTIQNCQLQEKSANKNKHSKMQSIQHKKCTNKSVNQRNGTHMFNKIVNIHIKNRNNPKIKVRLLSGITKSWNNKKIDICWP